MNKEKLFDKKFMENHPSITKDMLIDVKKLKELAKILGIASPDKWARTDVIENTQLDKQEVSDVINKLISKSTDIHSFINDEKIKEVEFFGDEKRELRGRGYMRWAFEDGCSESLIRLKKELRLK